MNLPVKQNLGVMPTADVWNQLKEQASTLLKSGFLPDSIRSPEQAIAIALKGWEMGIPMMQAFSHISIVKGKPCISAELMLAQMYKNIPGVKYEPLENDENHAVVRFKRPGENWARFEFNTEDARRADLLGKGSWKSYPKAMFLWRAVSMMARAKFPDAIMGCSYTPEEMGAEVEISDDGHIAYLDTEATPSSSQPRLSQTEVKPAPKVEPEKPKPSLQVAPPITPEFVPKVYGGDRDNNKNDQEKWAGMVATMKARNVPQRLWEVVHKRMIGKVGKEFQTICKEVQFEDIESQREEPSSGENDFA